MSNEELEQLLQSVPLRRLTSERERKILETVLEADNTWPLRWWARPVPMWQVCAACLAVFVITSGVFVGLSRDSAGSEIRRKPDNVTTRSIMTPRHLARAYRVDTADWRILRIGRKGDPQDE